MRVLVLLRGAPGCGKSTFVRSSGLGPYTLSTDTLRLMFRSPVMTVDGKQEISQSDNAEIWKLLFELLERRMKHGDFTVIDATHSTSAELRRYRSLSEKYKYRVTVVDFTAVPIELCKERNTSRGFRTVPDKVIDRMYERFKTEKVPSGFTVVTPEEFTRDRAPLDLSSYRKIVHIGDVHGCYTALMTYLKDGLSDDCFYIFLGDYLDRGIENAEVLKFLLEICDRPNVMLLEGNHERHIRSYVSGEAAHSKEFELVTRLQLDKAGFDLKEVKRLYKRFAQCAYYRFHDKDVFVCHGGISHDSNFALVPTSQVVNGVGGYGDYLKVAETWHSQCPPDHYQVFGHRNTEDSPIQLYDNVFCLEGRVEFGGCLRVLELNESGFTPVEIKNTVFRDPKEFNQTTDTVRTPVGDLVIKLRNNRYITEKNFGKISSFNFNRDAFRGKVWDAQTCKARGLFIDTENMKVVLRGYEKFFNVDEMPFTRSSVLEQSLKFPVRLYKKENGFLGLVSYDKETDGLLYASKSLLTTGEHVGYLKAVLSELYSQETLTGIRDYCREHDVTFVFEIVDTKHDPHIIKYAHNEAFLLTVIENNIRFKQLEYSELWSLGAHLKLKVKEVAYIADNYQQLQKDLQALGTIEHEGFVLEDASGFMVKFKSAYYRFWKAMRTVAEEVYRTGFLKRKDMLLNNGLALDFYEFVKRQHDQNPDEVPDLITLRERFYQEKNNRGGNV